MAGLSDYLENKVLDHILRNVSYTSPASVYVALHTADPTDAGTGTEVTGGSYARIIRTAGFAAASSGSTSNSAQVQWTGMPACTVTHVAIWDAISSGNMLFSGALSSSKSVNSGDTFTINASALTVTMD